MKEMNDKVKVDMKEPGTNTGHGHVWERPDGLTARCGGPYICTKCARDLKTFGDTRMRK